LGKQCILLLKLLVFSGLLATFVSCVKESTLNIDENETIIGKIFHLGGSLGKDAIVEKLYPEQNFGNESYLAATAWTNDGNFNTSRVLIEFDLTDIPSLTQIDSATLTLFWINYENLTGQTGENVFSISKITENWQEDLVTWNSQPSISTENTVIVPKSISEQQSYLNIDVTGLVQGMINNPNENYGFMLKLNEEFPYKLVIVASSDHSDESKHPKLVVYY
jgi:hypothetical protein